MTRAWIHGPGTDLLGFSLGWLPALGAFAVFADRRALLIGAVLFFNFLHRHLTFPFAYLDPEEFRRRRVRYLVLPPFFAALTAAALWTSPAAFAALAALAVLWTMFHSVQQKVGLLRVYSRKAGETAPWIDRAFAWSWFAALLLHLGGSPPVRARAAALSSAGRWLDQALQAASPLLPALAWTAFVAALLATTLFVRQEARLGFPAGKAVFALSLLGLYAVFLHDLVVGYAVFAFSHAVEYLVFANLYARRKFLARPPESSLLARAVRRQAAAFAAFVILVGGAFLAALGFSRPGLQIYVVGSGFLHFLYDGWLWRLRDPEVARPLELRAGTAAP
jgi:hypothetical protein